MPKRGKTDRVGGTSRPPTPSAFERATPDAVIAGLADLSLEQLGLQWRNHLGGAPPAHLPKWLLMRVLAYRIQAIAYGDPDKAVLRELSPLRDEGPSSTGSHPFALRLATTRDGAKLNPGALLAREWDGRVERVMVLEDGYAWNGSTFPSLSQVAKAITGTNWNGRRFFGLRAAAGRGKSSENGSHEKGKVRPDRQAPR
jgi:hypothetical protein